MDTAAGCYLQLPDGSRVKSDEHGNPLEPLPTPTATPKKTTTAPVVPTETASGSND